MCNITASPATCCAQVQQHILDQVDAMVDNFAANDPVKLLECSQVIVASVVDRMDVQHALGIYYHLVAQAEDKWMPSADRLQCIYDHFNDWIALELAKRYA